MNILTNYSMSSNNYIGSAFQARFSPKKVASVGILAAIAGMGIDYYDSFESEELDKESEKVSLYSINNTNSSKTQKFINDII